MNRTLHSEACSLEENMDYQDNHRQTHLDLTINGFKNRKLVDYVNTLKHR